ncbi:hypothetical protein Tco_0574064 [Tanacetum coccineum]
MTRSSTKELLTPFENPEREFRSSRKLFKTHGLDELSSPEFNLFSNQEENSKEEELRDNTFSGSDHEDANENFEKFLEIVDLFRIPNITQDQIMLRAFPMSLTGAVSHWLRNKPSGSIKTWDDLKAKFLSKYCPPARTAKKMEEINNFQQKPEETLYQAWERFKELLMKCPQHYLTKMQEPSKRWKNILKNSTMEHQKQKVVKLLMDRQPSKHNLIILEEKSKKVNEKVYATQVGCELCKGPHYTKDCPLKEEGSYGAQYLEAYSYGATCLYDSLPRKEKDPGSFTLPCYINNIFFENSFADLGASVTVMPLSAYLNLGLGELAHTKLTVEIADRIVKHPKGIAKNILVGIGKFVFPIDFIILDMPEDVKVPLILRRQFLSTAHAKIDVFKRKIILKARLIGETLILNRSLDLLYRDYIELNDLNVPSKLRRDQVNDLMPTIEEGEVVDKHVIQEVKTRNDDKMVSKFFGYTSGYEEDEKILVEDMDPYLDKGMGEVVVGELFAKFCVWKLEEISRRSSEIFKIFHLLKNSSFVLGLKRLHGFLEVTAAQVHNGNYAKCQETLGDLTTGDHLSPKVKVFLIHVISSFALRNFDLEDMELESTNSGPTAKLPILKLGEYEMWVIRIKQYFQIQDYALWEVIENGDSWVSVPHTSQENGITVTKMSTPATVEEKTDKQNDVKARATKKTQKTLLKQQYENFSATSAESLDSFFNRLQKIVSRLAILGVIIAQEDLNLKFLSSLPPEWNTHVVVWMNKPEVETMSIDDLYSNFKIVEQKVKKTVGTSSGGQNLAFMTAPSSSSTNDANTACPQVSAASPSVNAASP